jgi:hypothetical protein
LATKLEIFNLALNHLGMNKIASDSDVLTPSGKACNNYFDKARDDIFSEHNWPFASVELALVESNDDPLLGWGYMYRYPTETIANIWNVYNESTADKKHEQDFEMKLALDATPDDWDAATAYVAGDYVDSVDITYISILAGTNKIPASNPTYWTAAQLDEKVLLTDLDEAYAEASYVVTDILLWTPKFVWCVSWKLAAAMVHVLTGDAEKGIKLMGIYNAILAEEKRISATQKRKKPNQSSGYQNAR